MGGGAGGKRFQGTREGERKRQNGNTPMTNQRQNKQAKAVRNGLKLKGSERERLHRASGGMGFGYREMLEEAKDLFHKK